MTVLPRRDDARRTWITLSDLVAHASTLDVEVHLAHLQHGVLGFYEPETARVWISLGLTPAEQRSVLAHELGHVHYQHQCGSDAAERQADAYASDLLIDAEDYARLEREGCDVHEIADECGVTVDVAKAFRRHHLQRLGSVTYGRKFRGRFTNAVARSLRDL